MKTKRQLVSELKEALTDLEVMTNLRDARTNQYRQEKERTTAAVTRCQELVDQLRQLSESRSLEIRTEALRQARNAHGHVDLSAARRFEIYLSKGVTLPSSHAVGGGDAWDVLTRLVEESTENEELQDLVEYVKELELGQTEREAAVRGLVDQNQKLARENQDLHNEISEKTNRLAQLDESDNVYLSTKEQANAWEKVFYHEAIQRGYSNAPGETGLEKVLARLDDLYNLEKDSAKMRAADDVTLSHPPVFDRIAEALEKSNAIQSQAVEDNETFLSKAAAPALHAAKTGWDHINQQTETGFTD